MDTGDLEAIAALVEEEMKLTRLIAQAKLDLLSQIPEESDNFTIIQVTKEI